MRERWAQPLLSEQVQPGYMLFLQTPGFEKRPDGLKISWKTFRENADGRGAIPMTGSPRRRPGKRHTSLGTPLLSEDPLQPDAVAPLRRNTRSLVQGTGIGWLAGNPIRQRMAEIASNRLRDGEGGWKHWWGRAELVSIVGESDEVLGVGGLGLSQHSLFLPRSSGHRHDRCQSFLKVSSPSAGHCLPSGTWGQELGAWRGVSGRTTSSVGSPLAWESARLGSKLHPQHLTVRF